MSTIQNFDTTPVNYTLQPPIGGPPPASIKTGGPTGNFLNLATTPTDPVAGNNNSISFNTTDVGTFNEVTANWDFRVAPVTAGQTGQGMSFGLLNTGNYGTSGQAASVAPQNGIYNGSLGFGFDTQNDTVYLSLNAAIVNAVDLTGQLNLTSGLFIHAAAVINFQAATVSLTLTPSLGGSPVTVFSSQPVTGLSPYQSRVGFQALNGSSQSSNSSIANFDLDNVDVEYVGARLPGTIEFGSPSYVVNENQSFAQVDVVRSGGTAGAFTVGFVSADGTGRNGVNYQSVAGNVTFAEGQNLAVVLIPIIDDHLFDGNKTVKLYISNTPTFAAPLGSPIVSTLTIANTDAPPPTVSSRVSLVYAPHSRRVVGFRLQFSQAMDPASSQNLGNYEVLLPPAHKHGQPRQVPLSHPVLDPTGLFVTLTRANSSQHLTKLVRIIVRGQPTTGLLSKSGNFPGLSPSFLAGTGGVSGTDASLTVSI